ncbi:hypothetical protein [Trichormus variabilis]|uniref:hypothetical protein n=1 Tax=Anabaena variabilis TaxID=264691 RepID=UPI00131534D9|nr:hypothetical protein [Trichormus variabilis]MBD2629164.1 hypothetical protein [Trichormus variabilis FACHB-164]
MAGSAGMWREVLGCGGCKDSVLGLVATDGLVNGVAKTADGLVSASLGLILIL